jgi:pyruvate-ferredoxin/flavodoxin oxidoreductase
VYSNTGGQACTSGFLGQVSDMAAFGKAAHGKTEQRKEMGLIAMAHRGAYVLQSSQADPAHLLGGVLRGLASRRPAVFNLYTPCQAEHGLPDDGSARAARLALESRAFPHFVYDPDGGESLAEQLSLDGNPALDQPWPTYELAWREADGIERMATVPLTVADWAATEPRFGRHFRPLGEEEPGVEYVPFAELLALPAGERDSKVPTLQVHGEDGGLARLTVSSEMVALAEDRLAHWDLLREMAGVRVSSAVRQRIEKAMTRGFERELAALQEEHAAKLADLEARYPATIARRIAEALVAGRVGGMAPAGAVPAGAARPAAGSTAPAATAAAVPGAAAAPAAVSAPAAAPGADGATAGVPPAAAPSGTAAAEAAENTEPWIETELCTSCDECTRLNPKMFAYNANKQAYIADPRAGTFKDLVVAAERCTARIIHPGAPLDPSEPGLDALIERAAAFQ